MAVVRRTAHLEQPLLAHRQPRHLGIAGGCPEVGRKVYHIRILPLGLEAGLAGGHLVERLVHHAEVGIQRATIGVASRVVYDGFK